MRRACLTDPASPLEELRAVRIIREAGGGRIVVTAEPVIDECLRDSWLRVEVRGDGGKLVYKDAVDAPRFNALVNSLAPFCASVTYRRDGEKYVVELEGCECRCGK